MPEDPVTAFVKTGDVNLLFRYEDSTRPHLYRRLGMGQITQQTEIFTELEVLERFHPGVAAYLAQQYPRSDPESAEDCRRLLQNIFMGMSHSMNDGFGFRLTDLLEQSQVGGLRPRSQQPLATMGNVSGLAALAECLKPGETPHEERVGMFARKLEERMEQGRYVLCGWSFYELAPDGQIKGMNGYDESELWAAGKISEWLGPDGIESEPTSDPFLWAVDSLWDGYQHQECFFTAVDVERFLRAEDLREMVERSRERILHEGMFA